MRCMARGRLPGSGNLKVDRRCGISPYSVFCFKRGAGEGERAAGFHGVIRDVFMDILEPHALQRHEAHAAAWQHLHAKAA